MKNILLAILFINISTSKSHAQFSTDAPILLKMLANGVSQLYQLYDIVESTRRNYYLMREMYSGIHYALGHMEEIGPQYFTPMIYGHWQNGRRALNELRQIYGFESNSRNSTVERHTDMAIAEAMALSNKVTEASSVAGRIGKTISRRSNGASTKGAARLSAQGIGVMIETSGQSLKAQSEAVKLQAQELAIQNRKDKEETKYRLKSTKILKKELQKKRNNFVTPRF